MESYEKETSLKKEHVGALCSVVVIGNKVENFKKEKVSPFHVTCDVENEHLGKSGALGMCDDPYCTTCPTYFKACQQSNPKDSTEYDPKVSFFLKYSVSKATMTKYTASLLYLIRL
jgi:cyclic nucleotide gated channel